MSAQTGSLLEGVSIEVDKAKAAADAVRTEVLKSVAEAFVKNVSNAAGLISMPESTAKYFLGGLAVLFSAITKREQLRVAIVEELKAFFNKEPTTQLADSLNQVDVIERVAAAFVRSEDLGPLLGSKPREVVRLLEKLVPVQTWILTQLAAATSGAWTAFECLATDTWVAAVNSRPVTLAARAMEAKATGDESDAFQGKTLQVWQLAQYGFDLRNRMGFLLRPKFDMTSGKTFDKAFTAIFTKESLLDSLFKDPDLRLLEASRHVIVHNAGIVDEDFIQNTKGLNLAYPNGQPLPLDGNLVSRLLNAAIESGCKLLKFVDDWLMKNAT